MFDIFVLSPALHSEVRYSLIGGDSRGVFRVDALNGSLYVAGALDRERQDYYNLVVEARDLTPQPGTSLSSTCLVSQCFSLVVLANLTPDAADYPYQFM